MLSHLVGGGHGGALTSTHLVGGGHGGALVLDVVGAELLADGVVGHRLGEAEPRPDVGGRARLARWLLAHR